MDRFALSFKTTFNGGIFRHVVCGVYTGGRYGALGMSRRRDLMFKPLEYKVVCVLLRLVCCDVKEMTTTRFRFRCLPVQPMFCFNSRHVSVCRRACRKWSWIISQPTADVSYTCTTSYMEQFFVKVLMGGATFCLKNTDRQFSLDNGTSLWLMR